MFRAGVVMLAVAAASWLGGCANGASTEYIGAQEPKRLHSEASVADLVLCLKQKLGEDASIVAYPEPGKVDVRVGYAGHADASYFYVVSLRQAGRGSDVEIRSAGEWRPLMREGRIQGMVEDCKPGTAR